MKTPFHIVGLERNQNLVEKARQNCQELISSGSVEVHQGDHSDIKPLLSKYANRATNTITVAFFSGAITELVIPARQIIPILWGLSSIDCVITSGLRAPWTKRWHAKKSGYQVSVRNFCLDNRPTNDVRSFYDIYCLTPMTGQQRLTYLRDQMLKREYKNRELDLTLSADPLQDLTLFEPKSRIDLIDLCGANTADINPDSLLAVLSEYPYLKVIRHEQGMQGLKQLSTDYALQAVITKTVPSKPIGLLGPGLTTPSPDLLRQLPPEVAEMLAEPDDSRPPHMAYSLFKSLKLMPYTEASVQAQAKQNLVLARQAMVEQNFFLAQNNAFSVVSLCKFDFPGVTGLKIAACTLLMNAQIGLNYLQDAEKTAGELDQLLGLSTPLTWQNETLALNKQ